ncbi:MAG: response regulator [Candidatus Omnitrophica bacterium]|nr:response regulator [Candidatus Omnitrophota bacterium]
MAQILIIDDNDQFRGMLQEMLSQSGYKVLVASDGRDGVALYREKRPDLVITDVIMPEKDGAEVIFELQKEFPGIKMIVMTGGGNGNAQIYLKSIMAYSNVKHAFEKPFNMSELLATVKEIIG